MDNSVFYQMSSKGYLTTFAVTPDLFEKAISNNLDGPCSGRDIHHQLLYGDYITGEYPLYIHFPVIYRQFAGKKMRDVIDTRYDGHVYIISRRMKQILIENAISGWKSYPIVLYDKKNNLIQGYEGFTVTGRGGVMGQLDKRGNLIDSENIEWRSCQWDGTDVFFVKPNYIIVTERVRTILKKAKIEALSFKSLDEYNIKVI